MKRNNRLWSGDERGYNATFYRGLLSSSGCGWVMKEDITQPLEGEIGGSNVVVW